MNIPPLWIAILVACMLAVPLLLRMAGVRAKAVAPRKRLAFDDRTDPIEPAQEAHVFRLGRLCLSGQHGHVPLEPGCEDLLAVR